MSTTLITPYRFIPHKTIPIITKTVDQTAIELDNPKRARRKENAVNTNETNIVVLTGIYNRTKLYNYLTDGSIVFSLIRFINELEVLTNIKNQFDFLRFFISFQTSDKNIKQPMQTDEEYIKLFDCFGSMSYVILYCWKRINIEGKIKSPMTKCSEFHLFHIISNRDTLTMFLKFITIILSQIKSSFANIYTDQTSISMRELAIRNLIDRFLQYTDFPDRDISVIKRDEFEYPEGRYHAEWKKLLEDRQVKVLYPNEDTYKSKRSRFLIWCAQASNLNTSIDDIQLYLPLQIAPEPILKEEHKNKSEFSEDDGDVIYVKQEKQEEDQESRGAYREAQRIQSYRVNPNPNAPNAPVAPPNESQEEVERKNHLFKGNPFLVAIEAAYYEYLSQLYHTFTIYFKSILEIENFILYKLPLDIQIMIVEQISIIANETRLITNKANSNIKLKKQLTVYWTKNNIFIHNYIRLSLIPPSI